MNSILKTTNLQSMVYNPNALSAINYLSAVCKIRILQYRFCSNNVLLSVL